MALVDRVKNILLSPRTEWPVIDAEPATVASLYTGYIMPLAAIPVICQAIGMSMIGMNDSVRRRLTIELRSSARSPALS